MRKTDSRATRHEARDPRVRAGAADGWMTPGRRRLLLTAVVIATAAMVIGKRQPPSDQAVSAAPVAAVPSHASTPHAALPRLVDVGADQCIPCKMMIPVLDALRTDYAGRLQVVFVDAWKNPAAAAPYRVYAIPTQIFYAADGRELGRHQGYISKDDILSTWQRLGIDLGPPAPAH